MYKLVNWCMCIHIMPTNLLVAGQVEEMHAAVARDGGEGGGGVRGPLHVAHAVGVCGLFCVVVVGGWMMCLVWWWRWTC